MYKNKHTENIHSNQKKKVNYLNNTIVFMYIVKLV